MASQAISMESTDLMTEPGINAVRSKTIDENEIAARASELWQDRAGPLGSPELDWFRAKVELKRQTGSNTAEA